MLFREVSSEYLTHYLLRKQDRQTMAFQVRVLDAHFGGMPFGAIGERQIEGFFGARQAATIWLVSSARTHRNLRVSAMPRARWP